MLCKTTFQCLKCLFIGSCSLTSTKITVSNGTHLKTSFLKMLISHEHNKAVFRIFSESVHNKI